jgi:restriction system protein
MEAFIAIFSILYTFWPLILLFGVRDLFVKGKSFLERVRLAFSRIFIAWMVWAFFLGYLQWQDHDPVSLFPGKPDQLLFYALGLISGSVTLGWLVYRLRKHRIRLEDARSLEDLLAMSPEEFEALIATLFRAYDHRAEVAGGSGDHGVDVVVISDQGEKWIVQCKRYSGSVGEPVVRDLYGTMLHEEAQQAYLITTGSFTRQAADWVTGKPIVLYDGEGLVKLIRRTQKAKSQKAI